MRLLDRDELLAALCCLALVVVSLWTRPLIPIDETRYAAVAWEMWTRGDWLVPHLNGVPYSHKPPLLFWLVCGGWRCIGVSEAWVRLVPALFSIGSILLIPRVARRLWPDDDLAPRAAPWILLGIVLFAVFSTVTFFDPLLAFFVLLGCLGLLRAVDGSAPSGWLLFGVALGGGILSKGPVVFLHLLPVAVLAPWWARDRLRIAAWYGRLALAFVLGCGLALAWALPAAHAGGPRYAGEILWGQTADRVVQSFAHRRAFWFYFACLPVVLLPWSLWPPLYRGWRSPIEHGTRFCVAWSVSALLLLSLVSGKQPQYLLPLLPGIALLAARALGRGAAAPRRSRALVALVIGMLGAAALVGSSGFAREVPLWTGVALLGAATLLVLVPARTPLGEARLLSTGIVVVLALVHVGAIRPIEAARDIHGVAAVLRTAQDQGRPIAHVGKYDGQYQLFGRLSRPIEEVEENDLLEWARAHPDGVLVLYAPAGKPRGVGAPPELVQPYRGRSVEVWSARALLEGGIR